MIQFVGQLTIINPELIAIFKNELTFDGITEVEPGSY